MAAAAAPALASSAADAPASAVLGTSLALSATREVRMVIVGRCKMGISFWPSFRFSAPDREPQAGSVSVVHAAGQQQQQPRDDDDSGAARAVASGDAPTGAGAAAHAAAEAPAAAAGGEAAAHTAQVLHVDFPPDEVQLGARFLGCLPFPFLAMRTTRLAGTVDAASGAVELELRAEMLAQLGSRPPAVLPINARLTSEPVAALDVRMQGSRLRRGHTTLVSAAVVPATGSRFANLLLWLPAAATVQLPMRLDFA